MSLDLLASAAAGQAAEVERMLKDAGASELVFPPRMAERHGLDMVAVRSQLKRRGYGVRVDWVDEGMMVTVLTVLRGVGSAAG